MSERAKAAYAAYGEVVELIPAFFWTCPNCGVDQFERCVVPEMSQEDRIEAMQALGVEPWKEGDLLTSPSAVVCEKCGESFQTSNFNEEICD